MFKDLVDNILNAKNTVIFEYINDEPTVYTEADFEVMRLKISMALKQNHIDYQESCYLNSILSGIEKIWKKLNDK